MSSSKRVLAASAALLFLLIVSLATNTTANTVCPTVVANDPSPLFCASNTYGSFNVTRSQFENWNCLHPRNRYTQASTAACAPVATPPTCTPATCDQTGPTVCAHLASARSQATVRPHLGAAGLRPTQYTTAVFGNQCQLTLYNCNNPTQTYTAARIQNGTCTSFRL